MLVVSNDANDAAGRPGSKLRAAIGFLSLSWFLFVWVGTLWCVPQPANGYEERSTKHIECKIVNATTEWRLSRSHDATVVLTVQSHEASPMSVLASLKLSSLEVSDGKRQEYWAPLSVSDGTIPSSWEKLNHSNDAIKITARPGELLWGKSISSVWPSNHLGKVIPPGKYRLHCEISLENAGNIRSNDIIVTIMN